MKGFTSILLAGGFCVGLAGQASSQDPGRASVSQQPAAGATHPSQTAQYTGSGADAVPADPFQQTTVSRDAMVPVSAPPVDAAGTEELLTPAYYRNSQNSAGAQPGGAPASGSGCPQCGGAHPCVSPQCPTCPTCCPEPSNAWIELGEPMELLSDPSNLGGFDIGGWFQGGYHTDANGLFNNHPHNFNLHQGWLYIAREADGSQGFDWGFRWDTVYGVDAQDTQSFGNNLGVYDNAASFDHGIYGWALPQLYGEVAYQDFSVIVGHFYTLVGYEVVTAPDNFFYSHAYTMFNSEPFTHTGVLTSYAVNDDITLHNGWTLGWDTGFDQNDGGNNYLGGFSVNLIDDVTMTYITTIGDFGWREEGYSHSVVFDVALLDNLNYIFHSDFVDTNAAVFNDQIGANQYLIYTINDNLGVGTRLEWWKSDGNSQYEWTAGVNIRPHANLVFRPEVRHDWNPGTGVEFTTFGFDVIATY